ncbi:hypothetical protein BDM02DRAFT_3133100, partial [Thelephora ganbajun]
MVRSITPLIDSVSVTNTVSLPSSVLPTWVGLVELGGIEKNSVVLIHDALSRVRPTTVQIAQALGCSAFYAVSSKAEVKALSTKFGINTKSITLNADIKALSTEFDIDTKSITLNVTTTTALASTRAWLKASDLESFNIIFNTSGCSDLTIIEDVLSMFGFYVHYKASAEPVKLPLSPCQLSIPQSSVDLVGRYHPVQLPVLLSESAPTGPARFSSSL